jgi:hypothetical protein
MKNAFGYSLAETVIEKSLQELISPPESVVTPAFGHSSKASIDIDPLSVALFEEH